MVLGSRGLNSDNGEQNGFNAERQDRSYNLNAKLRCRRRSFPLVDVTLTWRCEIK
jgi:hypothetical protein